MATVTQAELHPIVADRIIMGQGTLAETWQTWRPLFDLPQLDFAQCFPAHRRVCIFAPHPDDEILGCGGLMQRLVENDNQILLVSVTNGTQSHPHSTQYLPDILNRIRPQETQQALRTLSIEENVNHTLLNLPDGGVYERQKDFFDKLVTIIQPSDILVSVFSHDGHPDHEATGQVVSRYAKQHDLPCYQVLIWAWHWAVPNDSRIQWQKLRRLVLTQAQTQKKRQALQCFTSQILPDPTTGQEAVLPEYAIERMMQIGEVFLKDN